jgi:MFS family permease
MDLKLLAIYLSSILTSLIYDVIAPFYPIEGEHKGASNFEVGLVFTAMPVAALLTSPLVGISLKVIGRRTAFIAGNGLIVRTR